MNRSTLIFFRYLFSAVSLPAGLLLLCACFSDIDELAEKARQGDPQAQRDLAYDLYCKGEMENAFHWYRKAAEAGDANAMCNLGTMYLTGRGTSVNQENAVKWLKRAAEQNDANAMLKLAGLYQNGEGVTQNHKEALKWIRKAVRRGSIHAVASLGYCYQEGLGIERNEKKALACYRIAAEKGNAAAQYNLGTYYMSNVKPPDYAEAVKWFRRAHEQQFREATVILGWCLLNGYGTEKNFNEGMSMLAESEKSGSADACFYLGAVYAKGICGGQDFGKAMKFFKKAAELGHPAAQKILNSFHQEKHLKIEISIYRISFIKKTYHSIRNKIISAVKQQSTTEDKIFTPHN